MSPSEQPRKRRLIDTLISGYNDFEFQRFLIKYNAIACLGTMGLGAYNKYVEPILVSENWSLPIEAQANLGSGVMATVGVMFILHNLHIMSDPNYQKELKKRATETKFKDITSQLDDIE